MASRRKNKPETASVDASNATTASVTEALLPDGVPVDDDGGVAGGGAGVDLDLDTVRKVGAIDADSARRNKTQAEIQVRKKAGEKNVRWNDTNGLVKYDTILQVWSSQGLLAYVTRIEPNPQVDYPPMPCAAIKSGQLLYDAILRQFHRTSGAATYFVRVREGTLERGSFNISLPDTQPLQQPQGMTAPWMMQQPAPAPYYPPQGYAPPPNYPQYAPPGYPPPLPSYDPYAQAQAQAAAQQQQPPQPPPAAAAPAAPAPAPAAPPAAPPQQYAQPQQQQPQYAQPQQQQPAMGYPPGYGQPMQMQPYVQPPPPAPAPPPTADPSTQAWMGTMYQLVQDLKQRVEQSTQSSQKAEMERLFAMMEELRKGSVNAPTIQQLQAQIETLSRQPPPPPPAPVLAPAAVPPPGFMGAPGGMQSGFGPGFGMTNPYAQLGNLPRPPGYPEHLPWPPNPWANPWGIQMPAQAQAAPAPPPPPPPAEVVPADPLESVRRSVEMVGTLASLMDRVRGVAPAVSESTATATVAPTPAKPNAIETMRVGDVDVAMRPDTGDISWMHTIVGLAPKAFSFLEKFSTEAAKTIRSHDAAQAVQSGKLPVQYVPMQQQQQQPQYPWPQQQPQFQPPFQPQPQFQPPQHQAPQHQAPLGYVPPPVQRAAPPPQPPPPQAAPPSAPLPAPTAASAPAAPAAPAPSVLSPTANGFTPAAPTPAIDEGIKSLFG